MNSPMTRFLFNRAYATLIGALVTLIGHYRPGWLGFSHPVPLWQFAFWNCWNISNWATVLDKSVLANLNLTAAERKQHHCPRTAGYWIGNLFAVAALAIPIGCLL